MFKRKKQTYVTLATGSDKIGEDRYNAYKTAANRAGKKFSPWAVEILDQHIEALKSKEEAVPSDPIIETIPEISHE